MESSHAKMSTLLHSLGTERQNDNETQEEHSLLIRDSQAQKYQQMHR